MGHKCSSFCRPSVTVNGRRYRVVKDLGEGGKISIMYDLISLRTASTEKKKLFELPKSKVVMLKRNCLVLIMIYLGKEIIKKKFVGWTPLYVLSSSS